MKKIFVRLSIVLIILILSVTFASPTFAVDSTYTGWDDFEDVYAEYSMFVAYYYEDNTEDSIYLSHAMVLIDNWGDHPWGELGILKNWAISQSTGEELTALEYPSIPPEDFHVEIISIGYDTYYKEGVSPAVASRTRMAQNEWAYWGQWMIIWWETYISTSSYNYTL